MTTVLSVSPLPHHLLRLTFSDGIAGTFDVSSLLFGEMFEPLKEESFFAQVHVDEFGTVCWPNGADLDTEVLHENVLRQYDQADASRMR